MKKKAERDLKTGATLSFPEPQAEMRPLRHGCLPGRRRASAGHYDTFSHPNLI